MHDQAVCGRGSRSHVLYAVYALLRGLAQGAKRVPTEPLVPHLSFLRGRQVQRRPTQ
jgi:hypothetical protein